MGWGGWLVGCVLLVSSGFCCFLRIFHLHLKWNRAFADDWIWNVWLCGDSIQSNSPHIQPILHLSPPKTRVMSRVVWYPVCQHSTILCGVPHNIIIVDLDYTSAERRMWVWWKPLSRSKIRGCLCQCYRVFNNAAYVGWVIQLAKRELCTSPLWDGPPFSSASPRRATYAPRG